MAAGRRKKVTEETAVVSDSSVSNNETSMEERKVTAKSANVIVCYNDPHPIIFSIVDANGHSDRVYINGNAMDLRGKERGILPIGKYGRTVVPREKWEAVLKKYSRMPCIRSGRLFAVDDALSADTESDNRKTILSGKEPIDPEKLASTHTTPSPVIDI